MILVFVEPVKKDWLMFDLINDIIVCRSFFERRICTRGCTRPEYPALCGQICADVVHDGEDVFRRFTAADASIIVQRIISLSIIS